MTPSTMYGSVAKFLHWTIALLIIGMICLGYYMGHMVEKDDPIRFSLYQWHKSIGITILLLSLFRLFWRLTHPAPPLPPGMKPWESFMARAVVVLFYCMMIGIPFLGWAMVSSSSMNIPTKLYGVIPWPHLPILPTLENKQYYGHLFNKAHRYLAYGTLGLLALHIGGALKHHFVNRDDVMIRMYPQFLTGFLNRLRG